MSIWNLARSHFLPKIKRTCRVWEGLEGRTWAICYHTRWPSESLFPRHLRVEPVRKGPGAPEGRIAILCALKCITPSHPANKTCPRKAREWEATQIFCLQLHYTFHVSLIKLWSKWEKTGSNEGNQYSFNITLSIWNATGMLSFY